MTKDQIIAWAKQAGAFLELSTTPEKDLAFLQRFAQLVAAQAAAEEREACAKVCESFKQGNSATYIDDDWADMCAAAIRERK